jgi:hypothetical protein
MSDDKHEWRMPAIQKSSYFLNRLARKLAGRRALVNYIYLTKDGEVDHQETLYGKILSIDTSKGVVIEGSGTNIITLPPDLRPWYKSDKIEYRQRDTGEIISDIQET